LQGAAQRNDLGGIGLGKISGHGMILTWQRRCAKGAISPPLNYQGRNLKWRWIRKEETAIACIEAASLSLLRHDVFYSSTDDDSRSFDSL
jgi:hypothetical protein